ncbi:MAG: hypothetical protein ABI467_21035 [Kofleriaceae bacterium]
MITLVKCWLVAAVMVVAASCGHHAADEAAGPIVPPKDAITKPVESGPVKVTERVWPAKPNLGDPIYLQLDIEAAAGATVNAPFQEAGDARLGRFHVAAFSRDAKRNADGSQHLEQLYTLDAPASGKQRIPPLRLEMVDARPEHAGSAAGKTQEILTEEVPLDIAPVKTEAIGARLKDAVGKLDPDVGGTPWMYIVLAVSLVMVLGAGGLLLYRATRSRAKIAARRSAYEEAVAKLHSLAERGAPEATDADGWFVELSAIARSYLERRYEIRAPELTTEEFLQVAARNEGLSTDHRALLSAFLERCDRVKFAGYRPDSDESLASLEAARAFVEDTRIREEAAA